MRKLGLGSEDFQRQAQQIQAQLQVIDQQIASLHQQRAQYNEYIKEVSNTIQTLKGLDNPLNSNSSILPLPGNVYLKTKVIDYENAYVNVGAGVVVPMPVKKAIETLEERVKTFLDIMKQMEQEVDKMEQSKMQLQQMLMGSRNQGIAPDPTKYS